MTTKWSSYRGVPLKEHLYEGDQQKKKKKKIPSFFDCFPNIYFTSQCWTPNFVSLDLIKVATNLLVQNLILVVLAELDLNRSKNRNLLRLLIFFSMEQGIPAPRVKFPCLQSTSGALPSTPTRITCSSTFQCSCTFNWDHLPIHKARAIKIKALILTAE